MSYDTKNIYSLDQKNRDIMAWISNLNFSTKQIDFFAKHQGGTGEWLLMTNVFKNWLNGTERTLWCPGLRMILPSNSFRNIPLC